MPTTLPQADRSEPFAAALVRRVVLDTNVVLDWLLFDDADGREVGRAVADGTLVWIATPAMRAEYFDVLGRQALERWGPDVVAHQQCWTTHCRSWPPPAGSGRSQAIRSRDPNDQMFVDLALDADAPLLLSRDRALLDLAGALRLHGILAMTPAAWAETRGDRRC